MMEEFNTGDNVVEWIERFRAQQDLSSWNRHAQIKIEITDEDVVEFVTRYPDHERPEDIKEFYNELRFRKNLNPIGEKPSVYMKNHFLSVEFHDNDFYYAFTEGLEEMWRYLDRWNSTDKTVRELIVQTDPNDLKDMIHRFVVFQDFLFPALKAVGIDRGGFTNGSLELPFNEHGERMVGYLGSFDIRFHDDNQFTKDWENGEHFYLNLHTGKANSH